MAQRRTAAGRREELLDGVMEIIAARGFADVRITDMASELRCSLASLYKIAPNKDSLVALAITRWGDLTLSKAEASAREGKNAVDRAKRYYESAAESLRPSVPRVSPGHGALRVVETRVPRSIRRLR